MIDENRSDTVEVDQDFGGVNLKKSIMDVILGTDGRWHGENADALNTALTCLGFTWPKRLTDVSLSDGKIVFGAMTPFQDQTYVPPVLPFRIVAEAGARLRAFYLHEIC